MCYPPVPLRSIKTSHLVWVNALVYLDGRRNCRRALNPAPLAKQNRTKQITTTLRASAQWWVKWIFSIEQTWILTSILDTWPSWAWTICWSFAKYNSQPLVQHATFLLLNGPTRWKMSKINVKIKFENPSYLCPTCVTSGCSSNANANSGKFLMAIVPSFKDVTMDAWAAEAREGIGSTIERA